MVAQVKVQVVFNRLPEIQRRVPNVVDDAVQAVAREGERIVKQSMQESPATGKTYGSHVASSPGNPPRIDTGTLRNSINVGKVKPQNWRVNAGTEYAAWLEFGTERMGGLPFARPFMGPMADSLAEDAAGIVQRYLQSLA
jgi:hypothetical protein